MQQFDYEQLPSSWQSCRLAAQQRLLSLSLNLTDGFCGKPVRGLAGPLPAPGDSSQRSCSDVREKKREPPPRNLDLQNADAKALCLRPDPELVKVSRVPARRRSVESCPSAAADEDLRSPPPARRRARGGVAKNTRAFATLRRRKTRRVVIGRSLNCWGESTSPMKARRPVELRGSRG